MSGPSPEEGDPEHNTLRVLLASDIHLGLNEKDAVRCNDARNTFDEVCPPTRPPAARAAGTSPRLAKLRPCASTAPSSTHAPCRAAARHRR